jgi:transposase
VQHRTALINKIRGFLLERGITFPAQPIQLCKPPTNISSRFSL